MGRKKEVKKAYSWDHKAKDVERVNDVEFERVQSKNDRLRIVMDGEVFRFDRTDINSYHGIYLGNGKYASCFDMDFEVDEEKLREFTIDAFIKANENKIHA